jgi:hypothetical protein
LSIKKSWKKLNNLRKRLIYSTSGVILYIESKGDDMENNYFTMDNSEGFTEEECQVLNEWISSNLYDEEDHQEIKDLQERATALADKILADNYERQE